MKPLKSQILNEQNIQKWRRRVVINKVKVNKERNEIFLFREEIKIRVKRVILGSAALIIPKFLQNHFSYHNYIPLPRTLFILLPQSDSVKKSIPIILKKRRESTKKFQLKWNFSYKT